MSAGGASRPEVHNRDAAHQEAMISSLLPDCSPVKSPPSGADTNSGTGTEASLRSVILSPQPRGQIRHGWRTPTAWRRSHGADGHHLQQRAADRYREYRHRSAARGKLRTVGQAAASLSQQDPGHPSGQYRRSPIWRRARASTASLTAPERAARLLRRAQVVAYRSKFVGGYDAWVTGAAAASSRRPARKAKPSSGMRRTACTG